MSRFLGTRINMTLLLLIHGLGGTKLGRQQVRFLGGEE